MIIKIGFEILVSNGKGIQQNRRILEANEFAEDFPYDMPIERWTVYEPFDFVGC